MRNKRLMSIAVIAALLSGCAAADNNSAIDSQQTLAKESASASSTSDSIINASVASNTEDITKPADAEENRVEITGDFNVNSDTDGYSIDGNTCTITKGGEYMLTGSFNGNIIVNVSDDEKVELMLAGVSITSSEAAPINIINGDKVTITAKKGTFNEIIDNREKKTSTDDSTDEEESGKAAIYSKIDMIIKGEGTLVVTADHNNGIHSKKDLSVKNVTLKVTAVNNALKGNDSVTIESGEITLVTTEGDGIKTSDNEVSDKGNQKGNITILDGHICIDSADDAINAKYDALISGGNIVITAATKKGKGIHADNCLQVDGGNIEVTKSYEGLEANAVVINGGSIKVYATDDGVNASDGSGSSMGGFGGFGRAGGQTSASSSTVTINGGYLEVETASGDTDGIDVNGSYSQTGGMVLVKGGASSGNVAGSIDVDGEIVITGGTTIALGGICESPTNSCNAYFMSGSTFSTGSYVLASEDTALVSFNIDGTFSNGWICSELLEEGKSYSLSKDGSTLVTWTQEAGNQGNSGAGGWGGFNGGGFNGGGFNGGGNKWNEGNGDFTKPDNIEAPSGAEMPDFNGNGEKPSFDGNFNGDFPGGGWGPGKRGNIDDSNGNSDSL